jgi:hypothetical protein
LPTEATSRDSTRWIKEALKARDAVFEEANTHNIADRAGPSKCMIADVIIKGLWTLTVPGPVEPDRPFSGVPATTALYNLKSDPLERNDVAKEHPEIVAKVEAKLDNQ